MTKLKVTSKFRLFVIISIALMVIGMAMGTIGHFLWKGFFNYGDEFSSYKSIVVRYSVAEHTEEEVNDVCKEVFASSSGGYSVSCSEALRGGEIVYKFSANADDEALNAAARIITEKLNAGNDKDMSDLNVASVRTGTVKAGGSRALIFASIAVSSAAAFMFLYYIFRYKLRAALSALLACVHNLGLFLALVALTRLTVGAELIALSALIVFLTMLGCGVFFDKVRKNFKNEKYADSDRAEVVEISAAESHKINMVTYLAFIAVTLVFSVFAAIASMGLAPIIMVPLLVIGMFVCCYGTIYFTPSAYAKIDALCEKVKTSQDKKTDGKSKPVSDKAQA